MSVFEALDSRRLILDPEPAPRLPSAGEESPYATSAVDLRLANEVAWLKDGIPANVDLRSGRFHSLFSSNSEQRRIEQDQPYALGPNKLVLGKTLERVTLPLDCEGHCLAARVEGKSSFARCGLLVHFTAPTIHAGFHGNITLELINMGPLPILLYPHMYICQLIIEQVDGKPVRNDSQFQGQSTAGGGTQ
ncbi:MAG: dCTP deaminase [Myxococcota bacterium]